MTLTVKKKENHLIMCYLVDLCKHKQIEQGTLSISYTIQTTAHWIEMIFVVSKNQNGKKFDMHSHSGWIFVLFSSIQLII